MCFPFYSLDLENVLFRLPFLLFDKLIHKMDPSIVLVVSPSKENLLDAIVYKTGRFK